MTYAQSSMLIDEHARHHDPKRGRHRRVETGTVADIRMFKQVKITRG